MSFKLSKKVQNSNSFLPNISCFWNNLFCWAFHKLYLAELYKHGLACALVNYRRGPPFTFPQKKNSKMNFNKLFSKKLFTNISNWAAKRIFKFLARKHHQNISQNLVPVASRKSCLRNKSKLLIVAWFLIIVIWYFLLLYELPK